MNFFQSDQLSKKIVKSPINPILYLCFVSPVFIYLSTVVKGYESVILFFIGILIIIGFLVAYFYLLFTNPEYLRSERYQLQMEQMRFYGDKDNPKNIEKNDIESLIKNPNLLSKERENESK